MQTTSGRLPVLATLISAILFVFAFAFASSCAGGLQSDPFTEDLGLMPDLTETSDLAQSDLAANTDLMPQCRGRWWPPAVRCPPGTQLGDPCDDGIKASPSSYCDTNGFCLPGFQVPYTFACRDDLDCCGADITVLCPRSDLVYIPTGACREDQGTCGIKQETCPAGTRCTPDGCK